MSDFKPGDRVVYMPAGAWMPENGTVVRVGSLYVMVRFDGQEHAKATRATDLDPEEPKGCIGECMSGYEIGLPSGEIAYPHPDCPVHGDTWTPHDNEWSRQYVADHPERFGGQR